MTQAGRPWMRSASGSGVPGGAAPAVTALGVAAPGAEALGAAARGGETPGAEARGGETPGAEARGGETPGAEAEGVAKGTSLPIERHQSDLCTPNYAAAGAGEGQQTYLRDPIGAPGSEVAPAPGREVAPAAGNRAAPAPSTTATVSACDWAAPAEGAARLDERRFQYCLVQCAECGAVVQAAKFSAQHTSVQWDVAAVRSCTEFARRAAAGEQTPLIERCDAMRVSIELAVREGRLPVAPP
jgi:hypothetical protein